MKRLLLFLTLLCVTFLSHAQSTFEHVFYSSHNTVDRDACRKGLPLPNGEYIAMGSNPGCEFCGKTYYVRKYDHQGNLLFEKLYHTSSGGDSPDIIQTKDGNLLFYFAVGFSTANLTWDYRLYFLKMDLNGDSLIAKNYYYERFNQNYIGQIQLNELADSSIIYSCNEILLKLTPELDSVKVISLGQQIYSVNRINSDSELAVQHTVQIIGVDTLRQTVYSKDLDSLHFLFSNNSNYKNIFGDNWWMINGKEINDSSFVTIVRKNLPTFDSIAFVKFDNNLVPFWIKYSVYPKNFLEFRGWEFDNNTVTYWGTKYDNPSLLYDSVFYYRLNIHTGDSLQFKVFSAQSIYRDTWLEDLKYCSEGYLISGHAQADTTGWKSYFAVLDSNGNVMASVPVITVPTMNVFNNPTSSQFEVELGGEKEYTFVLRDELGKIMEIKRGNMKISFNIQNYPAGNYFLQVTGDNVKRSVMILKL